MSGLKNSEISGKIFAVIAGCEFLLFIILFFGDEKYNLMCMSGIILCGMALVIVVLSMIFSLIKERMDMRRAALKALGKHGLKVVANDESARVAYKGILKLFQGNYPDAEELLMKSLSMSNVRQNQLFCVEWLIRVYEETENEARLLWAFRRAAEIAPDNPEVQARLGHAYWADGKLTNAEYCFEQALKYDPNHGYSYYSLALIYTLRGEDERALETLKRLENIQAGHPLVQAELATWYAMHDDEKSAEEHYDKAILCGYKEPEQLSKRMTALRMFNHAEEAGGDDLPENYYRRIEKEEPKDTEERDADAGNV